MKHDTSTALYEYWLSAQADHAVRAGGISAVELAPLLPDLFLLECFPPEPARFRFCGAAMASRYGRDLTGESFLELWESLDQRTLERDLALMASRAIGLVAGVMGETIGAGVIAYEMLLLPLVGARGGSGAIGSMARVGGHDEKNRIRGRVVAQSLRSIRFLTPVMPLPARWASPPIGALRQAAEPSARRYGHLTVVNGGK